MRPNLVVVDAVRLDLLPRGVEAAPRLSPAWTKACHRIREDLVLEGCAYLCSACTARVEKCTARFKRAAE